MIQTWVKDKLTETKLINASKKRAEIRKYLDYYTGTSVEQYITEYFNSEAFKEIPPSLTNFTRKFINKISRIYTLGASRTTGSTTDAYQRLIPTKDVRMKHIERMTTLVGTVANRVYWQDGRFEYRPIYYFETYFGDNPFKPEAIIYPLLNNSSDLSDTLGVQWAYWDADVYAVLDGDGGVVQESENTYGVLPFVFTHREDQIDSFYVEGASDIINCNEQINIGLTEMNLGLRFNMFGQPWVKGLMADQSMLRSGSDTILDMGDTGEFNITSPSGNIADAINHIKFQIELVASNNHLWIQWAESGGEVPSGISLMIKDMERKEDYYDDIALWRLYERDFYDVEKVIAKYNGIQLSDEFGIDFEEVEYPTTVQDQILKDEFDLLHNLTTNAKMMVRDNKDLTEVEAESRIKENRVSNEQAQKQSIFTQFRQEAGQDQ